MTALIIIFIISYHFQDIKEDEDKKPVEDEYMAGFLAGVQASKSDVPHDEVKQDSVLTKGEFYSYRRKSKYIRTYQGCF